MEQINSTIFNIINEFARMKGILDAIMILSAKYMPFLFMEHLGVLLIKYVLGHPFHQTIPRLCCRLPLCSYILNKQKF